jgi:crotonobetainyl-CoA:carnitine CoA-transferase CaiB-like acyl-CoA transferase
MFASQSCRFSHLFDRVADVLIRVKGASAAHRSSEERLMAGGLAATAGPLAGVTVVEAADAPGPAFAAALAADFGATVIVCEPLDGSPLRRLGPAAVQAIWWPILARNKRSLAIEAAHPSARSVLARLLEAADIVVCGEGAAGAALREGVGASRAVELRLFAPGADRPDLWPWSTAPEFAAAASGMMALTGDPDGPAVQPEMPLADYTAGMLALSVALAELRAARRDDRAPAPVRLGLHEALHRMNEWQLAVAAGLGRPERRNGNRFPMNANIGNVFRSRDGKLLTVSAATPSVADRLLVMIGGPALRDDPRFSSPAARRANMDALDGIVAAWIAERDADDAMRLVRENDVVVGPIYDAAAILEDRHMNARGDIARLPYAEGEVAMPAALPMTAPAGAVREPGPAVGRDTLDVLRALGLAEAEIATLCRSAVVRQAEKHEVEKEDMP